MKIVEIQIYGYGKIENQVIKDLDQLHVFYGPNEAGKSTIMSFIHSILFGFPTKQQTELRYEPKNHTKYGGKLIILHPVEGKVVIERVKGKSIGDVLVKLESGHTGGEELLSKLLKNMDKGMYQSIYSFNLNGLQNIHQLKSEDLGKFLFSTGAVGTDKLLKVESALKKELENRFKPGGKKPILNEQLKELHELHQKLKEAGEKNDAYSSLIQKRLSKVESIESLQLEMKNLQHNINRMKEWKNQFAYVQELKKINQDLDRTKMFTFPTDGIKRFDSIVQLLKPMEAVEQALLDKQEKLKLKLSEIEVNETLLQLEIEVEAALTNTPIYDQLSNELIDIKFRIKSLQLKMTEQKEKLHYSINDDQLAMIDTSIFMKEKIGQAQLKYFRFKDQKQMLDGRFLEEKNTLEQLEKEIVLLEEQILPVNDRNHFLQLLKSESAKNQVESELKEVQEKINFHKELKKINIREAKKLKTQSSFLLLFIILSTIWSGINKEWIPLFIASFSLIVFSYFFFKKPGKNAMDDEVLKSLIQREKQLMLEMTSSKESGAEQAAIKISMDDQYQKQLQLLKLRLSQQQLRYEQVILSYENWETESMKHNDSISELIQMLMLPKDIPFESLNDAFHIISDLKDLQGEMEKLSAQQIQVIERQNSIVMHIKQLAELFLLNSNGNVAETTIKLKEALKEAQQNNLQFKALQQKLEELKIEIGTASKERQYLAKQLEELLIDVNAKEEEEFRFLAKEAEKRELLKERSALIKRQIEIAGFSITDYEEYQNLSQLDDQIDHWDQNYQQLEGKSNNLQKELAEIKFQISFLEEGGTFTELLHRYKQQKYELEEQAKIWGTYAVAKNLLTRTIEKYKVEKLPVILKKAEEYFTFLTMGSYIRIHPKEDSSGFLIERNDHTFFEANELSQATMEQIYVSLRLALATTIFEKIHFPIIIDDSFVNFDQQRTKRMIQLLGEIKEHQILFFTCHSHLLFFFEEKQILQLEKKDELLVLK
ncbi:AAA family ATPase [Bacillus sp. CGMCC 1.16607]|uniref:ATP-binding protein n=1 Tax=Bacillus sp. CGMCC 1.16607 TaxID=3351842 RepID=UPI00362DF30A